MARRFFDHTGDIGVALSAESLPVLFREAARAFTTTLVGSAPINRASTHHVSLTAAELDDLMVDWLGEVHYLFEVRNLLAADADVSLEPTSGGWQLEADVHVEPYDEDRHQLQILIKGITYHRLHVEQTPDGWQTDVVFDI
jgi:SHS2 domain-containing protein